MMYLKGGRKRGISFGENIGFARDMWDLKDLASILCHRRDAQFLFIGEEDQVTRPLTLQKVWTTPLTFHQYPWSYLSRS